MIFNEHLDRLMEVKVVQDFMQRHNMQGKMCSENSNHVFILYRYPYVIGFWDALIENYLQIALSDSEADLLADEGTLIWCSTCLNYQSREDLKNRSYTNHPQNDIFLSDGAQKMYGLHTCLEAIDKLLPLIEAKGGLSSMRDGTFDPRFDFKDSVKPMWHGLKENYLKCINNEA